MRHRMVNCRIRVCSVFTDTVVRMDCRRAAGPRLKEGVRHSLVDRGIHEDPRLVKVRLDAGKRQKAGKLDVGDRRRRLAYPLEIRIAAGRAARPAYHDEASLRQPPCQLKKQFGPFVVAFTYARDPEYAVA